VQFTRCHRSVFAASSGETDSAGAAPRSGGGRRRVVVGGRRVKTIDVHAHCIIPEAQALLGIAVRDARFGRGIDEVGAQRLQVMDEQGIDIEALSINPTWYRAQRDIAERVVSIQNERLAEHCAANSDRFVAFASVALQFADLAAQQLEYAVKQLGLRGAAVGATVADDEFAEPKFHPFWAKAEELGVLIFLHPQGAPDLARRLGGNGWLVNTIGNPLDTTIALSHLIFGGTLDRFPGRVTYRRPMDRAQRATDVGTWHTAAADRRVRRRCREALGRPTCRLGRRPVVPDRRIPWHRSIAS
jgi:aminocarboxymuconate-semialdehyde decarboxylase